MPSFTATPTRFANFFEVVMTMNFATSARPSEHLNLGLMEMLEVMLEE